VRFQTFSYPKIYIPMNIIGMINNKKVIPKETFSENNK